MPAQHRLGREQEQTVAEPSTGICGSLDQVACQESQRQFLPPGKARCTSLGPLQAAKLLAEEQDFESVLPFRLSQQAQKIKEHRKEAGKHGDRHTHSCTA
jgi:hypothetical protein